MGFEIVIKRHRFSIQLEKRSFYIPIGRRDRNIKTAQGILEAENGKTAVEREDLVRPWSGFVVKGLGEHIC